MGTRDQGRAGRTRDHQGGGSGAGGHQGGTGGAGFEAEPETKGGAGGIGTRVVPDQQETHTEEPVELDTRAAAEQET